MAGTNPNLASDVLRLSIQRNALGQAVLGWLARTNRLYSICYREGALAPATGFQLHDTFVNLTTPTNGWLQRVDTPPPGQTRFYLLRVRRP